MWILHGLAIEHSWNISQVQKPQISDCQSVLFHKLDDVYTGRNADGINFSLEYRTHCCTT